MSDNAPFVSIVTPTFRREGLLARCVESVLAQQWDGACEVTVVNDAGEPLAFAEWQNDPRVRVVNTFGTERSVARNTGAALSRGNWLFFLDDDDYVLPGAFASLMAVAETTEAALVYGGFRTENTTTGESIVHQPVVPADVFALFFAGEMLPLQCVWMRRSAFWTAGGFDPFLSVAEDTDLLRRISWDGTALGTPDMVSVIRVAHPTSTSPWEQYRQSNALSYDKCLARPCVIKRLVQSAGGRAYWRGRCARECVAAAARDVRRGRYALVAGKLSGAARLSAGVLGQGAFWRGLRRLPDV